MNTTLSRLHFRSLLAGFGIAAALMALSSFAIPTPLLKTLRILLEPDPASIVRIPEGGSFVVPPKLSLVIKAAADSGDFGMGAARILINGSPVLNLRIEFQEMVTLPFPLVAQAGDVVTVVDANVDPNFLAFVTGYLSE